jgi:hypothetical protein
VTELLPDNPPQFMNVPFADRFEPIKESLVDAGFTDITARVLRRQKTMADARPFARGIVYGSPLGDQLKARPNGDPEAVVTALTSRFDAAFGRPASMPLQAIMFEARKP